MSWARVLAPVTGSEADASTLAAGAALAGAFDAELSAVFAAADAADLTPWMGEGFMGGVQIAALDSLKEAAQQGEAAARDTWTRLGCARGGFDVLPSPVWSCLCMEARLSDVVVFGADAPRGRGALADAFQQVLMEERRPVLVARRTPSVDGLVAVAWDGGREASRAARSAIPWLQKAREVVVLAAPAATPRRFEPERLVEHFAARGVTARIEMLDGKGEAGPVLMEGAEALGADILVAGAFGHPRFQQFIFGGVTRTLMQAEQGPSLFLSH